jgi:hypothetical protein
MSCSGSLFVKTALCAGRAARTVLAVRGEGRGMEGGLEGWEEQESGRRLGCIL